VVHVVWEDQGDGDQDIFYRRGFEAPPVDNTPPDVQNVLLDGMPSLTYPLSSLPATISLTATVDDSARGNSVIGGANFTIGPGNWATSTLMMPDDFLDSSTEGFHYDVVPPATTGTWQYCAYGWDIVPNHNIVGQCATLTIIDDMAPLVTNVLIDGFAIRTIQVGTPSVSLTGVLDGSSTGNSNIGGANYTSPQKNWANSMSAGPDPHTVSRSGLEKTILARHLKPAAVITNALRTPLLVATGSSPPRLAVSSVPIGSINSIFS